MTKQTIAAQLIDFIDEHKDKINRENFCTVEFVIANGNLDGMRVKEYIKAKKANANWEKRVESGITTRT